MKEFCDKMFDLLWPHTKEIGAPKYRFVERKSQVKEQMRVPIEFGGKSYMLIIEET